MIKSQGENFLQSFLEGIENAKRRLSNIHEPSPKDQGHTEEINPTNLMNPHHKVGYTICRIF